MPAGGKSLKLTIPLRRIARYLQSAIKNHGRSLRQDARGGTAIEASETTSSGQSDDEAFRKHRSEKSTAACGLPSDTN